MTANQYNPDSTGVIKFNFNQTVKGEVKSLSFSANLIPESGMTLAAQTRHKQALMDRDMLGITAARISGRLRGVVIDGVPQKLSHSSVLAYMESEDDETQDFVTQLVKEFSVASGISVGDIEENLEKN